MNERRHEYAVVTAKDEGELAELLTRLDEQGYMIRNVLATATGPEHEPIVYTVVGVRDREGAT